MFSKSLVAIFALTATMSLTIDKATATPAIYSLHEQNTIELVDRAKQLYLNQQYAEASKIWQQAANAFKAKDDTLNEAMALSNLALTQQKLGDSITAEKSITSSIELLEDREVNTSQQRVLANSLDIRGSIERSQGDSQKALETWQQAAVIYRELDNNEAIVKNQINQAQALQDLGYYRRASKILQSVRAKIIDNSDSFQKIDALLSFGNNLRVMGNLEQSQSVLRQAAIAKELDEETKAAVLLSLGNTIRALGNRANESQIQLTDVNSSLCLDDSNSVKDVNTYYLQSFDCYQQAALTDDLAIKVKAQLNILSLIVRYPQLLNKDTVLSRSVEIKSVNLKDSEANLSLFIPNLIAEIKSNLTLLPNSRSTIYDRLNLVQTLICLQPNELQFSSPVVRQCGENSDLETIVSWQEIEREINLALQQAEQLQDTQAQAYALGYLGAVYQQTGNLDTAEQFTKQALLTLNNTTTSEIAYLWQWQLGRVYRLQERSKEALTAYNAAFDSLQSLRQNLVGINPEMQFAFRDRIEPVYRERAALLLQNPSQENLIQTRNTIEALQLAQLNNFFQEACLDATPQQIEAIDPKAAVIYGIILPDRIAVILSQSGKPLTYHQTPIDNPQEIDRTFEDLYANLNPFLVSSDSLQPNQTFYNWLIRPLETELQQQTNTLVFVLDGVMRGIPVASLHDGEQYLIEKYSLALTPGLQLLSSRSLNIDSLQTIAGGLTEPRQGFTSLPNVQTEISEIATLVPSDILLNENFTSDRIQSQVTSSPYPIVHLATHGQFSSNAEDTFLLTWSDRINVLDLDRLLQERGLSDGTPIELLILSACQTATGDKQAALGLAGVAVRSGARSTMATLWSIQDDSTAEFMTQFYRALKTPGISKAEALRQAQLSLIQNPQYQHPFYWSAFVLVGNWL